MGPRCFCSSHLHLSHDPRLERRGGREALRLLEGLHPPAEGVRVVVGHVVEEALEVGGDADVHRGGDRLLQLLAPVLAL